MRLVKASLEAPAGLVEIYGEIGDGEHGFMSDVSGELGLDTFLQRLVDMSEGRHLREGWVTETTFWLLDDAGSVVGVSRLRHTLTPFLLNYGGNIGYYVARDQRGKGYGTRILALALEEARKLGLKRVLLTVDSDNERSIRVIEANGGVLEDKRNHAETGEPYRRYWINLDSR